MGPASTGRSQPSEPRWYLVLSAFTVLAFAMTFRSLSKFDTHVVGNSGDSLFVMWILGWVQHAIPHGWDAVWNTSIYSPTTNTLAYSESMLSVALVDWPLRALFGPVVSLNILAIAAQTATLWFMYRLSLLLTGSWLASVAAALMFGFSTPLLSHFGHAQLTLSAFLVPLTLLLLVRYLRDFRLGDGIGVGIAFAVAATSATYYMLMLACGVTVVVFGYFVWFRPRKWWPVLRGLVAGAVVAAAITVPVAVHYMKLQDDPYFKRGFDPNVAAHVGDFLSIDGGAYVVDDLPLFDDYSATRGIENHLLPGLVASALAVVGIVVVVRSLSDRRRVLATSVDDPAEPLDESTTPRPDERWRARMTTLIVAAGAVCVVLAFGDETQVLGQDVPLPFKVFRKFVPGFSGIRATSRFVLLAECAIALVAAFGVRQVIRHLRRSTAVIVAVVLCGLVLAESARSVPLVEVPRSTTDEAAARYLDSRPPGVVAELPIRGINDGAVWAYTESPRQFVSLIDNNDRINGYSGYTPPGFDALVPVINAFPSPEAMRILDRRKVRYVVLRTKVIGDQLPGIDEQLDQDGVGRFTPATARERIAQIPPDRVRRVTRVPGAYVVELRK